MYKLFLRFVIIAWLCFSSGQVSASGVLAAPVGSDSYYPLVYGSYPAPPDLQRLGRKIFFDASLSASGKMSCATCHQPSHAYAPGNALSVQMGGDHLQRAGFRNTPSLTYTNAVTRFTEHFMVAEATGGQDDEGPTGGHTWDGRVDTGHAQAMIPLLDENEMANQSDVEIAEKLRRSTYADEFRRIVSAPNQDVFENVDDVVNWMGIALESFEQSATEFYPFNSKFDAYMRDEVTLTASEKRGFALFNDPKKGNCASCHTSSQKDPQSHPPVFSDFGYAALGVPRNKEIPANAEINFYDLGMCGPLRTDLKTRKNYCGLFRTPSLRNVAKRHRFFHNGVFHSLQEVLEFYVTRDLKPARWYGRNHQGKPIRFNDLPEEYHQNVNKEIPFKPLKGDLPRLSPREIKDVIAFLKTLNDGYVPPVKPIPLKMSTR